MAWEEQTENEVRAELPGARGLRESSAAACRAQIPIEDRPSIGIRVRANQKARRNDGGQRPNFAASKLRLSWRRGLIRLSYGSGDTGLAGILLYIAHFLLGIVERLLLVGYFLLILGIFLVPLSLIA